MISISSSLSWALETGATLIVPSAQRAAAVYLADAAERLARGQRAWRSPDVQPYGGWLEREAWRAAEAGRSPRPLRAAEEWLLWQQALAAALPGEAHAAGLAESLQAAARLLYDWNISPALLRAEAGAECALLGRTLELVEERCRELQALPSHRLAASLPVRTEPLHFAGFSECTRARGALLRERGAHEHAGAAGRARILCASARDDAHELDLLAHWCRERLRAEPASRLLVILPDLAQRQAPSLRRLRESLAGAALIETSAPLEGWLAVEGGAALAHDGLARHALTGLKLLLQAVPAEELSTWLRAPCCGIAQAGERAQLDVWLRRVLAVEVTAAALNERLTAAPSALEAPAQHLRRALEQALRALGAPDAPAGIGEWMHRFAAVLAALDWPGGRALTSPEQQTRTRFEALLAECTALGAHLAPLPAARALSILDQLAARTAFQPATGDCAVTVSSALADPIVRYDGIWVAGLHAESFPESQRLNPFLPPAAQRAAGIPGASAAGMLARARRLLEAWQASAPELVVSWPQLSEDRHNRPSPLIAQLPRLEAWQSGAIPHSVAHRLHASARLERLTDEVGLAWPAGSPLPSGTRALEFQGRCAFRAHAELRLRAEALAAPRPGIDPRERGRLLHRALELLWSELGDSRGLERLQCAGTLERTLGECVTRAAAEVFAGEPHTGTAADRQRECRRAVRVLRAAARAERERGPFRIQALELRRALTLGDASLEVRIDRIDALEDGTQVLIDYKSGRGPLPQWLGARLIDAQLPAYLLAAPGPVRALALLRLAPERALYRGLAAQAGRLPGLEVLSAPPGEAPEAAWAAQERRWQEQLEHLAGQFRSGAARRDPAPQACRLCHLHALCRIAEAQGGTPDADAAERVEPPEPSGAGEAVEPGTLPLFGSAS